MTKKDFENAFGRSVEAMLDGGQPGIDDIYMFDMTEEPCYWCDPERKGGIICYRTLGLTARELINRTRYCGSPRARAACRAPCRTRP